MARKPRCRSISGGTWGGYTQLYYSREQTRRLKLDSQTQWALVTELLERGVTLRIWGSVWGRAEVSLRDTLSPSVLCLSLPVSPGQVGAECVELWGGQPELGVKPEQS